MVVELPEEFPRQVRGSVRLIILPLQEFRMAVGVRFLLRPRAQVVLLLLVGALFASCSTDPVEGELDQSGITVARYNEAYQGQIAVLDYNGPVIYALASDGEDSPLPPGLSFDEAGRVTGTPSYVGTWDFEVLASGMEGVLDIEETVSLTVTAQYVEDVGIGYEHDQVNNMTDEFDLMSDIWLRVSGGGVEGVQAWTMNPGLYLPGPDGVADGGYGDDVRIGDISFSELDVEFYDWEATGPVEASPDTGHPSAHNPEDDPPVVESDGTFRSGADGGRAHIRLSHPDYEGVVERRVLLVPPDWCPLGVDAVGGGGGPSETRYCE